MNNFFVNCLKYLIICICCTLPLSSYGKPLGSTKSSGKRQATLVLNGFAGMTTYKSTVVKSNDTGITTGYSLATYAGESKNLGLIIQNDSTSIQFAYAHTTKTSLITTTFQDTMIPLSLWYFFIGPVISQTQLVVTNLEEEYLDAIGSGFGATAGIKIPFNRRNELFARVVFVNTSTIKDRIQADTANVSLGSRTDIEVGGSIKLTKSLFELLLGYKQRTYSINVSGVATEETQLTTWSALSMNLYF